MTLPGVCSRTREVLMLRRVILHLMLVAALVVSVRPASAQKGVTELGFDMAIAYETESEVFSVTLPLGGSLAALTGPQGGFRAGFFLGDMVSLEPSLNFQLLSGNDETEIAVGSSLRVLYHFSADATHSRIFLAAGPTFTLVDFGNESSTQFGLNGELGVKLPIADRIGARLGVGYTRGFESDEFNTRNIIYGTAGLSMFLGGT
jgi:hypothetical protein